MYPRQQLARIFRRIGSLPKLPETLDAQTLARVEHRMARHALMVFRPALDIGERVVLDLGCGLGGKTLYYAEQGARLVVGLDVSTVRAHVALELADRYHTSAALQIAVGDAAHLPFIEDVFDTVISTDTWEHLNIPKQALSECARLIRPGGVVAISAMPYFSPWGAHAWNWLPLPWIQLLLPWRTLCKLMAWIDLHRRVNERLPPEVRIDWTQLDDPAQPTRLTVAAFERDMRTSDMILLLCTVIPVGARFGGIVAWMTQIMVSLPLAREALAGLVVAVMRKPPLSTQQ